MPDPTSPFHAGELAAQQRLGVQDRMAAAGRRMILDHLPAQHRAFYALLPMLFVATTDDSGQPWASLLSGAPGFLHAPDAQTLVVSAAPPAGDMLAQTLREGAPIGGLGLEFHTRRRNRINGTVAGDSPAGFSIRVQQAFGNCPKYIQARHISGAGPGPPSGAAPMLGVGLDAAGAAIVAGADTLFIATRHPGETAHASHGLDISHRGGKPGFVRRLDASTLAIPDYVGNFIFNTVGNLLLDGRAGLLIPEFTTGDLLQLAGQAEVLWDGEQLDRPPGVQRWLRFHISQSRLLRGALPGRWEFESYSPHLEGLAL